MSQNRKEYLKEIREMVTEEINKIEEQEKKPSRYSSMFKPKYEFAFGEDLEREKYDREKEQTPGLRDEGDGWDHWFNSFRS